MSAEPRLFKSHGKFLITAEYLILKGAVGLALPLKRGQTLIIQANHTDFIQWESSVLGKTWFECKIHIKDLKVISTTDEEISNSLVKVLSEARSLNPSFIETGITAKIDADFNLAWGLGSSSTLINNIAEWAKVDPYVLLEKTFGGSGYDIACAGAKGPLTYQLSSSGRSINEVSFQPAFFNHIFFVYLGKKMNSRTGMSYFKEKAKYGDQEIEKVNAITREIIHCSSIKEFEHRLREHENLLSNILQLPTIKESNFTDYPYCIKSMGAWGGDFVLVTGNNFDEVKRYFESKGLDTVIPYHDIVLS
jgi:mevalonate kinase